MGERIVPDGAGPKALPRERTLLGTGMSQPEKKAEKNGRGVPSTVSVPSREKTVLGVGSPRARAEARPPERELSQQEPPPEGWDLPEPVTASRAETLVAKRPPSSEGSEVFLLEKRQPRPREPSIAVDLSELEPAADERLAAEPSRMHRSLAPVGVPRRRPRRRKVVWLLALLSAIAVAVSFGYPRRDSLLPLLKKYESRLISTLTRAVMPKPQASATKAIAPPTTASPASIPSKAPSSVAPAPVVY